MENIKNLKWENPDKDGVWRAYDHFAGYTTTKDSEGGFKVGYFPAPGPLCDWEKKLVSLNQAKASAEKCAEHVAKIRKELGY